MYGENDSVSVYRISDNTLVQSYSETVTEADEENDVEARTDITENHFGTTYSSVVKHNSVSYTTGNNTAEYSYTENDNLISEDYVKYNNNTSITSVYEYDSNNNITSKEMDYDSDSNVSVKNTYDSENRITATGYYSPVDTYYTYDSNSQLVRSDHSALKTSTFTYDDRGNILLRNKYSYTRNEITSNPIETTTFAYSNDGWNDKLISVNGTPLTYDANGNVLTYGDKSFTWSSGRNLAQITDGDNTYSYTYDENGIRTSKTVNGVTTYYNTKDGVILSQTDGTNTLYFQYDTNGIPLGLIWNGTQYFYLTNQMGDVISITDAQGVEIIIYEYDEWGKTYLADSFGNNDLYEQLVNLNPIRYRGYYLDNETGYYYLQSRYYDPSICRFINADAPEYAQMQKNIPVGTNLFAYCCNDPVNKNDTFGTVSYKLVYIFYDPDDFYRQAKDEQSYWKKKIKYSIVRLVSIKDRNSFINYWNNNVGRDSIVVWIFHGGPYRIHTTSQNFERQHVSSLSNLYIDTLYIYACNCGHLDVKDNIANKLKSRLTRTKKIYAMDGSISYYSNPKEYKGYKPRLSINQYHYYQYARIITLKNRYGSIIRYSRLPSGLYRVK